MEHKVRSAWGVTNTEPLTSVFQNNKCEWLSDELNQDAIELNFFEFSKEWETKIQKAVNSIDDLIKTYGDYPSNDLTKIVDELNELKHEPPNDNMNFRNDTWLIGYKENEDGMLEPDPKAEYSAIVGEVYTQVVCSKWGVKGNHCSPCYPCQVDPDSDGDWIGFSLPPEVIGEIDPDVKKKIFKLE